VVARKSMQFSTEIRSGEFPAVFGRFEEIIGSKVWRKRVAKIRDDIRGNPYLREWLLQENRIAYVLSAFSAARDGSRVLPAVQIQDARQYETVAFVTQTTVRGASPRIGDWLARLAPYTLRPRLRSSRHRRRTRR